MIYSAFFFHVLKRIAVDPTSILSLYDLFESGYFWQNLNDPDFSVGRNNTQTRKQHRFFFLPESIHHIFYWQDCYHWLIYILQQRKYINNSWRRFEELIFSFFLQFGRAGPSEGLKIWRGAGASSNRRSYNGTGFASISATLSSLPPSVPTALQYCTVRILPNKLRVQCTSSTRSHRSFSP